jgi:GTP cyclohydrolase III
VIQGGRYKDVNAIGVASIFGVRNAVKGVSIPFIFGGDVATILIPGEDVNKVKKALAGLKNLSKNAFSLDLRTGLVPVADLQEADHSLSVCRHAAAENIPQTFIRGEGIKVA